MKNAKRPKNMKKMAAGRNMSRLAVEYPIVHDRDQNYFGREIPEVRVVCGLTAFYEDMGKLCSGYAERRGWRNWPRFPEPRCRYYDEHRGDTCCNPKLCRATLMRGTSLIAAAVVRAAERQSPRKKTKT